MELLRDTSILALRRRQLRRQRDTLAAALNSYFPDWQFRLPDGGLTLWTRLPYGGSTRYAAAMQDLGIHLAPGPVFAINGGADEWLRIPFTHPEGQIYSAVRRLAELSDAHAANNRMSS
jgi:DNA-binding transcriptional MocR family regulator